MEKKLLANIIDHTALKAQTNTEELEKLCKEVVLHNFASVCVNPCNVNYASQLLRGSRISVCSVVGYPLGANKTNSKIHEAKEAIKDGAEEIEVVINIGKLKDKEFDYVESEIRDVKLAIGDGHILKVIIETSILTREEKISATELIISAGADYVKTSSGMNQNGGATIEDVSLLTKIAEGKIKIKASGGIDSYQKAVDMLNAGASRIGTSSSINIIKDA